MARNQQKPKQNSTGAFEESLQHPIFKDVTKDIQRVCAMADRLHRTVSGSKADQVKRIFLNKLRKLILKLTADESSISSADVLAVIFQAQNELRKMDSTPSDNPSDWKVPEVVAQVKMKGRRSSGGHEVSGGAPQ